MHNTSQMRESPEEAAVHAEPLTPPVAPDFHSTDLTTRETPVTEWSDADKKLVWAAGLAPLLISGVILAALSVDSPDRTIDVVLILLFLVVPAYLTLLFSVLPSLVWLRRRGKDTLWAFAATCGISTVAPWFLLLELCNALSETHTTAWLRIDSMADLKNVAMLCVPGGLAALYGAVIHVCFEKPRGQGGG